MVAFIEAKLSSADPHNIIVDYMYFGPKFKHVSYKTETLTFDSIF
jgi:hypothetical protein